MRKLIIAGNWKMHKGPPEASSFVRELWSRLSRVETDCEVIVAPPFVSLVAAAGAASGTQIRVAAQNLHWEDQGAYTGEISGGMLTDAGCTHVIIGHSERRQYFGETDESVKRRLDAALRHALVPIFCLGETLEERDAGKTFDVVRRQLTVGLGDCRPSDPDRLVLAYEPVWAIGTGRTAAPDQAQEVHQFLRSELGVILGSEFSQKVRILYGGSIKPENTRGLMSREDIDGGLVGGASLQIQDFLGIIGAAT
jgi:triosephosphate isomerase